MSGSAVRPAKITRVLPGSIAEAVGFEAGDRLVSINGQAPRDLIDYNFLCADELLRLEVLDAHDRTHVVEIEKDYDDELGLEFEAALFDGLIQCNNRCPFCFIDQQPPGKRASLYYKDDDYRLSFLYGSYLTLTNLTQREWDRIEQLRLSPLFVSVHATEPEVRSRLLKNPRAGEIMQQLAWFRDRRLQIHAQVVLCPGINDGAHLERTIRDLASFYGTPDPTRLGRSVVSPGDRALSGSGWAISENVVLPADQPVGATSPASEVADSAGRSVVTVVDRPPAPPESSGSDGGDLGEVDPDVFDPRAATWDQGKEEWDDDWDDDDWDDEARTDGAIEGADRFESAEPQHPTVTSAAIVPAGLTQFRPADDELQPVTPAKAREVIAQVRSLQQEFRQTLGSTFVWLADEWFLIAGLDLPPIEEYEDFPQIDNGVGSIRLFVDQFQTAIDHHPVQAVDRPRRLTWVVGNTVERPFAGLVDRLNRISGLTVQLAALNSDYWGQSMTVTGLLTGQDLIAKLCDRDLGDALLVPSLMLRHGEQRFLDDMTVQQVSDRLQIPIVIVTSAEDVIHQCTADAWPEAVRPVPVD
jgi:NifB/MoaA-like Fe-S oxidoreductase